jgi:hypothetical protein
MASGNWWGREVSVTKCRKVTPHRGSSVGLGLRVLVSEGPATQFSNGVTPCCWHIDFVQIGQLRTSITLLCMRFYFGSSLRAQACKFGGPRLMEFGTPLTICLNGWDFVCFFFCFVRLLSSSPLVNSSYWPLSFYTLTSLTSRMWQPKRHVILRRSAMLMWMHDNKELVKHVTLSNNTKSTLHQRQ